MVVQESALPDPCKTLRFHEKNGRITGYWVTNALSDPELKFLIDSVMYGGREKRFKLRVKRACFTQLVDTFSHSLIMIPGSDTATADTVDVLVNASEEAMRLWLLQYGDIAEALDMDSEFAGKMRESIEILQKKYE